MSVAGAQFGIGLFVAGGYGVLLTRILRRESQRIEELLVQREAFVDLNWESRLPPEHLRAAGVTMERAASMASMQSLPGA